MRWFRTARRWFCLVLRTVDVLPLRIMISLLRWEWVGPANPLQAGRQYPHEASTVREFTLRGREKDVKKDALRQSARPGARIKHRRGERGPISTAGPYRKSRQDDGENKGNGSPKRRGISFDEGRARSVQIGLVRVAQIVRELG